MKDRLPYGIFVLGIVLLIAVSCGVPESEIDDARTDIKRELTGGNIYERGNLPDDPPPTRVEGYFDVVGGAIRYVENEDRYNRNDSPAMAEGDSILFFFDARIYTGSFANSTTFYTNIEARREQISGNNFDFDPQFWPIEPLRIKLGNDPRILKSIQSALIGCRAGDGDPDNDEQEGGIASDNVRIYLTPDVGFGNETVYNVPSGSTLVFEITEIEIIE